VPGTRTSATWIGLCATALAGVLLIVFMLQNTGSVEVSFLWLDGSLPLALALFIAGVGAGLLAMIVGSARMTQLRRHLRQRR
jgi:putative membrane protein